MALALSNRRLAKGINLPVESTTRRAVANVSFNDFSLADATLIE